MLTRYVSCAFVAALLLEAVPVGAGQQNYKGFPRGQALITVEELKQRMDQHDSKLVVLAVVEPLSYGTGHIPNSINVWRPDYEQPVSPSQPIEGVLLERQAFQDFARGLGNNDDSQVVVYDEKYDATTLWWAFYLYGKTDVRVLDGGYPGWKAAGYPVSFLPPLSVRKTGTFTARAAGAGLVATMGSVRRAHNAEHVRLWDTREPAEWSGEEKKGNAKRAGRIPWARFQSWKEYRTEINGKHTAFKSASEVQQVIDRYGMNPTDEHIFYCHSGVRSTTAVFALYLMGWDPARLFNYDGSWLEWSYYESNPVLTGR